MEYSTGDLQCLNLDSTDLDRLASLADSYFSNRENEEEAFDSASDSSSDDENADEDDNFDYKDDEDVELMEVHMTERAKVQKFYTETCKCKLGPDEKACSLILTLDDFVESRNNCKELSSTELDLVLLGTIQSSLNCNDTSISGRVEKNRQHARMAYFYHGKRICMKTFLFLHGIHNNRLYSLVRHYRKNGLTLRVHGNAKRLPSSASAAETVEQVVKFIKTTAEEQAFLLPGRDENVLTGKGANSTISYVHYFFERHGLGETNAQLHADNCGAQNKNLAFLWYYLWRVTSGLHNTVNYHFLLPGHTKFAPDWCFGLVKQKTRRTFISSLFDIARAVEESAVVNTAELVGLHNGTVRVPTYDWVTYLQQYFKKLP